MVENGSESFQDNFDLFFTNSNLKPKHLRGNIKGTE